MQSCTMQTFTAPVTGNYLITVAGAQGGGSTGNPTFAQPGGLGAVVEGAVTLQAGASIPIIVGSTGGDGYGNSQPGGGGGGLSAVYTNGNTVPTIVAGTVPSLCDMGSAPGDTQHHKQSSPKQMKSLSLIVCNPRIRSPGAPTRRIHPYVAGGGGGGGG